MRKIDLYQAEPEAILGDGKNMHALKEKLLIDNLLLMDIETDYQRDKEGPDGRNRPGISPPLCG